MGETTLALSAFNESLALNPRQIETRGLRGSLLRKLGDLEGARYDYQNALQLDPENPALIYALGLTQVQLGMLVHAEANIATAADDQPDNPGITSSTAYWHMRSDRMPSPPQPWNAICLLAITKHTRRHIT